MKSSAAPDPVESVIAKALDRAGVEYVTENNPLNVARLDFFLPQEKLFIECKRMASERTAGQLNRADDVIVVQGLAAAQWLAAQIAGAE